MKLFVCCLIGSLFYVALADVKKKEETKVVASDKSSASKPKRDASFLSGMYHGPSYKYLPPSTISSVYATYPGTVGSYAGYSSGGQYSGIGNVYRTGSSGQGHGHGHGYRHHGYSSSGNRNIPVYHNLENENTFSYPGGHNGYVIPSTNHYPGQGSTQFIRSGYKGNFGSHAGATKLSPGDFSASRPHTFAFANGNSINTNPASAAGGYQYTNGGLGGSFSSPSATGFQSADGITSSLGIGSHEEHHGDHVHNGAQEHVYVVSNIPAGFANSYDTKQTSVPQYPLPSNAGASFNTKYYTQSSDPGPTYAGGHKGLGHFSFTANKPQAVHASLSGTSFQQPSYSKAPFKPSTFLGAKFEGSVNGDVQPQQYLPPLEESQASTGYDYPIPTETYQEPHHHQTVDVQATSLHEPDTAYLPPKNHQDSLYELSSNPSGNYLPPSDSYGVPYAH